MSEYYCHSCALIQSLYQPVEPDKLNLTASQYQLNKFMKHTAPTSFLGTVSVFDDPSYDKYKSFTVNTSGSGSVERDDQGRTNVVWYAGKDIGVTYVNGQFLTTGDTVKVVLHDNQIKVHSFPVDSFTYERKKCRICGRDIIY